jgi:hypothetical protein
MYYELWDLETGNIINTYQTEAAALAVVCELISSNGPDYAEALALGRTDARGKSVVAEGRHLVSRARAQVSGESPHASGERR